jgi:hypothetical protein
MGSGIFCVIWSYPFTVPPARPHHTTPGSAVAQLRQQCDSSATGVTPETDKPKVRNKTKPNCKTRSTGKTKEMHAVAGRRRREGDVESGTVRREAKMKGLRKQRASCLLSWKKNAPISGRLATSLLPWDITDAALGLNAFMKCCTPISISVMGLGFARTHPAHVHPQTAAPHADNKAGERSRP